MRQPGSRQGTPDASECRISATRRQALVGGAAALFAGLALKVGHAVGAAGPIFVGCRRSSAGDYRLTSYSLTQGPGFDLGLPDRGHSIALSPVRSEGVVFARRPGAFAVVFDHAQGVALRRIDAVPGRHFYGHGAYSPDGRYLFASENDIGPGDGVIGIYDAADDYRRLGEMPSRGVGPHDIRLMPDGRTLVVANGGILTRPETGRAKLNLDVMQPFVSFIEADGGGELDRLDLPPAMHQLSMRHLDVAQDGAVAVGMQYQGSKRDAVPLLAIRDERGFVLLDEAASRARRYRHYIGSVAFDRAGRFFASSAPRAGLVAIWDRTDGSLAHEIPVEDGCGIARAETPHGFVLTGAQGRVLLVDAASGATEEVKPREDGDWDNHIVLL